MQKHTAHMSKAVYEKTAAKASQGNADVKKGKAGGTFHYGEMLHILVEVHQPAGSSDLGCHISEV